MNPQSLQFPLGFPPGQQQNFNAGIQPTAVSAAPASTNMPATSDSNNNTGTQLQNAAQMVQVSFFLIQFQTRFFMAEACQRLMMIRRSSNEGATEGLPDRARSLLAANRVHFWRRIRFDFGDRRGSAAFWAERPSRVSVSLFGPVSGLVSVAPRLCTAASCSSIISHARIFRSSSRRGLHHRSPCSVPLRLAASASASALRQ